MNPKKNDGKNDTQAGTNEEEKKEARGKSLSVLRRHFIKTTTALGI